eukprot:930172-Pyramimonas_sp.AAC.1
MHESLLRSLQDNLAQPDLVSKFSLAFSLICFASDLLRLRSARAQVKDMVEVHAGNANIMSNAQNGASRHRHAQAGGGEVEVGQVE